MIAKLKIEVYEDNEYLTKVHTIALQINPEDYKEEKSISYEDKGDMSPTYEHHDRNELSISFTIDGTGVVPSEEKVVVSKKIRELETFLFETFTKDVKPRPITQPYFLLISWGNLYFRGRLKKMDVHYTLFKPNGEPLRAKVNLVFVKTWDDQKKKAKKIKELPSDKKVVVNGGETLAFLCNREYGDSTLDTKIAGINGLSGLRSLKAGQVLTFPTIDKL